MSEHSGSGLEHMKAFHLESRIGSLRESLSHPPSTVGLDEQRQSMVLELYYRKAGRKREGRRERERDWSWPRGEKGKRRERRMARVRGREQEGERAREQEESMRRG